MGFPRKRIYNLEFRAGDPVTDGAETDGAEHEPLRVRATAPTLLDSLEARRQQSSDETERQWLDRKYQPLIDAIQSWNLEDEDEQPLPVTLDAWYTIDLPVQLRIYGAWSSIGEEIEPTSPLDRGSGQELPSGSTTAPDPAIEASIPTQALP